MKTKKFFYLTLFTLSMIIFFGLDVFAFQTDPPPVNSWQDFANELIGKYFATTAQFAALVTLLSQFILTRFLTGLNGIYKQLITFGIALILSLAAYFAKFGLFADMTAAGAIWTALNIGMGSNSIFDFFKNLFKKKEEV